MNKAMDKIKNFFNLKEKMTVKEFVIFIVKILILYIFTGILIGIIFLVSQSLKIQLSFTENQVINVVSNVLSIIVTVLTFPVIFKRINDIINIDNNKLILFTKIILSILMTFLFYFKIVLAILILILMPSNLILKKKKIKD